MRSDQPQFFFALLDAEFFESFDRYRPGDEYERVVREHLDDGWVIARGGFWSNCQPIGAEYRTQGWKIHLSAATETAPEVLARALPVLAEARVPFKFCSDARMLELSTSKNWPRTGAAKFITVYPESDEDFPALAARLHEATEDLRGPYILSDRSYPGSRVVFYRYGEHRGVPYLDAEGHQHRAILTPEGERYSDQRQAIYRVPPWVADPFGAPSKERRQEVWLRDRYRVTGALRYSSVGGIYLADDTETGEKVVIREARPLLSQRGDATDALGLLEKEARILRRLGPTGLLPRFVDLFQEWEHRFLVQERLQAESLWGYAIGFLYAEDRDRTPAEAFGMLRDTLRGLIEGLRTIHAHGVVLRDMTKTNVFITPEGKPKFIDFELAYETDRDDPPLPGWTVGYASPDQLANQRPRPEDDYYALGSLLLDMLAFTASGLPLNRGGILQALEMVLREQRLPPVLKDVVVGLTDPDPARRWGPDRVLATLDAVRMPASRPRPASAHPAPPPRRAPSPAHVRAIEETVAGVARYIEARLDFRRGDRLWPASGELFVTNPVSLQHGAAGTAAFLLRATGRVPEGVLDWIVARARPKTCPPGLWAGLAGVATFLFDAGRDEDAKALLEASRGSPLIHEQPGLYYGAAGWGLANLYAWLRTGEEAWLDEALETGERLVESAREVPAGVCWDFNGVAHLGLGYGTSGVCLFLTSLNAAAPGFRFLDAAEKGLDFEISEVRMVAGRPFWFPNVDARVDAPKSPHMRFGSAGVGSALLRFWAATGEPRFRRWADACAWATCDRLTNKTWHDYGLAGYIEYLLDMHRFAGGERYLHNAFRVAEALLPHRIARPEGIAFAGPELMRISCDFGMGAAGIGTVLHRLLNPAAPRAFFPDELLLADAAVAAPVRREPALAG
ncbi:MAG TPA: class III lanthionine synthetase LanKC [Longimicrobium sp.]